MAGQFSVFESECLILCLISWFMSHSCFLFDFVPQAVVIMGLVLQWANLYGYVRCKVGGKSNLGNMAKNYLGVQLFKQVCEKSSYFPLCIFLLLTCIDFSIFNVFTKGNEENRGTLKLKKTHLDHLECDKVQCWMERFYWLHSCWTWLVFPGGIWVFVMLNFFR